MRRTIAYPFVLLGIFLFCWMNLPKQVADRLRSLAAGIVGTLFDSAHNPLSEWERLQVENQNLRAQIDHICTWLLSDQKIQEQVDLYQSLLQGQKVTEGSTRTFLQRRADHLRQLLLSELQSVPARVIYRDPSSWSSSLWVSVGEEDNRAFGQPVIRKNSPVLAKGALVGVVDYVGHKQSRVRLITDSGLSPAVRAVRGEELEDGYLAKGELYGSSAPFWRARSPLLKGIGFNYDYPDEEGPARDLKNERAPLLKEGDFLVTSGLDGVFPPGLRVGTITRIAPLREGAYAYEIEAKPAAAHLNDLQTVFILPALASD